MSRLLRKPQATAEAELDLSIAGLEGLAQTALAGLRAEAVDGYLERMAKYVPAEIVAFSMIVNAILDQAIKSGGPNSTMAGIPVPMIAAGALVVACLFTPVFCWYVRRDGDAWALNAFVSTLAFPFWAYLMGAVAFDAYHDGNLAVILVLSFTIASGIVSPRPRKPRLRAEEQEVADDEALVETSPLETPRLVNAVAG